MQSSITSKNLQITDDVPGVFAQLCATEINKVVSQHAGRFRFGCSGGSSGEKSMVRLSEQIILPWSQLALYYVDERCVPNGSPDANRTNIERALGSNLADLGEYYPMDCLAGPASYNDLVQEAGAFDLLQLGFGPDGHTASIFPDSTALTETGEELVVRNDDPSGRNPFGRITLTYRAISMSQLVVFTVIGEEKADALRQVADGADLPATRVTGDRILWLCDHASASKLPPSLQR